MLEKVEGYGYRNIGFILDRGYFSVADIHYMDNHSYGFVIMVKGMKDLVSELVWREHTDVIDREIALCGYFVLITSEDMTAEEAINLYKSRDVSEKLFRGDKSYMGASAERVYGNELNLLKLLRRAKSH